MSEENKRETPESCTKPINQPCRLHPVDCDHCRLGARCQVRETMQAHKDKIKRCRFYRPATGRDRFK